MDQLFRSCYITFARPSKSSSKVGNYVIYYYETASKRRKHMYKIIKLIGKNKTTEVELSEDDYDTIIDGLAELRERKIEPEKAQAVLTKLKPLIFP